MIRARFSFAVCALALVCTGCAYTPPSAVPAVTGLGTRIEDARWFSSCFRMPLGDDGAPRWAVDLALADRVLAPLLATHQAHLGLWRFHRRAGNDVAGHQFSLLVYVSAERYAQMRQAIDGSTALRAMIESGLVREVVHECRAPQQLPLVEATSDPAWDPALQRAWPYFIMGVSASWLALVQEFADAAGTETDVLTKYQKVEARINKLWGLQGRHAFLHHLSAVYGYQPLRMEQWLRF